MSGATELRERPEEGSERNPFLNVLFPDTSPLFSFSGLAMDLDASEPLVLEGSAEDAFDDLHSPRTRSMAHSLHFPESTPTLANADVSDAAESEMASAAAEVARQIMSGPFVGPAVSSSAAAQLFGDTQPIFGEEDMTEFFRHIFAVSLQCARKVNNRGHEQLIQYKNERDRELQRLKDENAALRLNRPLDAQGPPAASSDNTPLVHERSQCSQTLDEQERDREPQTSDENTDGTRCPRRACGELLRLYRSMAERFADNMKIIEEIAANGECAKESNAENARAIEELKAMLAEITTFQHRLDVFQKTEAGGHGGTENTDENACLGEAERERDAAKAHVRLLQREIEGRVDVIKKLEDETRANNVQMEAMLKELEELKKGFSAQSAEAQGAKRNRLSAENETEYKRQISELLAKNEVLSEENEVLQEEVDSLNEAKVDLELELSDVRRRYAKTKAKYANSKSKQVEGGGELEALKTLLAGRDAQIANHASEIRSLREELLQCTAATARSKSPRSTGDNGEVVSLSRFNQLKERIIILTQRLKERGRHAHATLSVDGIPCATKKENRTKCANGTPARRETDDSDVSSVSTGGS